MNLTEAIIARTVDRGARGARALPGADVAGARGARALPGADVAGARAQPRTVGRSLRDRRGFTLIELLVVVAMIAVILGAITTSVTAAQNRARIQKATSDVKVITQAILGYENFKPDTPLPTLNDVDADSSSLGFLLGDGGTSEYKTKIPVLLMAALQSGGKMRDPWGNPYRVRIRKGSDRIDFNKTDSSLRTGFFLPNFYRLATGERDLSVRE